MKKIKILIAEPDNFSVQALAKLNEVATVDCRSIGQGEVRQALQTYDVIWVRLRLQIRSSDIPDSPRCQFVVSATTGTDHLDLDHLRKVGIQVLCLREEREFLETIGVTAELTLGLILSLVRRLPAAIHSVVQQGRWDRDAFRGIELFGKTAGIVGLGRLGKKMAQYLAVLGMNIIAWDPFVSPVPGVHQAATLEELLQVSHVVTIHIPLTHETRAMINANFFKNMLPGAFFVNTSRGALVDEPALLDALKSGHLAGAALDVVCGEPDINLSHPLVAYASSHDNLIITPHIGGAVEGIMARCEEYMTDIVLNRYYA